MKYAKLIAGGTLAMVAFASLAFAPITSATNGNVKLDARAKAKLNANIANLGKRFNWLTKWEGNVDLKNTLTTGLTVKGKASVKRSGVLYDVNLKLRAENFPPSTTAATAYEAWLVSDSPAASPNAGPMYQLSLGAMMPDSKNRADINFSGKMINPKVYTRLVITQETINDMNPNPGTPIFSAELNSLIFKQISLKTTLMGSNEVPAVDTKAAGKGQFIINTRDNTLSYELWLADLSSAQTAAHIHGPARAGANADVLFTLSNGNHARGTLTYDQSLEDEILRGETYVNVHTQNNPSGEIRGQIVF